ncbi:MAG TPA: hypothetical protein VFU69_03245 [Ktedonobacterales bacterium]|nr:hypothetical protein [Ktedonobacterales bacterium]
MLLASISPDDLATAIEQALVQGGSQWLILSIVAFLPALWTTILLLHIGRPYLTRVLRKSGLRFGADVWWMSYVLMRDAFMLATFVLSFVFFMPNLVNALPLPLTGSLSALFLLLALVVKLLRKVDDDLGAYRLSTILLVIGATLYFVPQVLAVEGASLAENFASDGYANFTNFFVTASNLAWAWPLTYISMAGVLAVGTFVFLWSVNTANRKARAVMAKQAPTTAAAAAGD